MFFRPDNPCATSNEPGNYPARILRRGVSHRPLVITVRHTIVHSGVTYAMLSHPDVIVCWTVLECRAVDQRLCSEAEVGKEVRAFLWEQELCAQTVNGRVGPALANHSTIIMWKSRLTDVVVEAAVAVQVVEECAVRFTSIEVEVSYLILAPVYANGSVRTEGQPNYTGTHTSRHHMWYRLA